MTWKNGKKKLVEENSTKNSKIKQFGIKIKVSNLQLDNFLRIKLKKKDMSSNKEGERPSKSRLTSETHNLLNHRLELNQEP